MRNYTVEVRKKVIARYLELDVAVRYEEEDMPNDAPGREGDSWKCMIDLEQEKIINWPQGKTLQFFDMKVCDEGQYTLFDFEMNQIAHIDGYVPNSLLPGSYGDYLDMSIDENGKILNWKPNANLNDFSKD